MGLDGEGRVTQVTASSGQNPVTGVTYNTSSLATQVNFGSGDSDVFAYDSNTLRMTQFKFNVGAQSFVGGLTWNANGTPSTARTRKPAITRTTTSRASPAPTVAAPLPRPSPMTRSATSASRAAPIASCPFIQPPQTT